MLLTIRIRRPLLPSQLLLHHHLLSLLLLLLQLVSQVLEVQLQALFPHPRSAALALLVVLLAAQRVLQIVTMD